MSKQSDVIQASVTTLRVAEALKHLEGARVTELATHLGLPKSTIHYHLRTLMQAEFIVADGNEYRIGLRFLDFGEFARDRVELLDAADPALRKLAGETGEIASLLVEEHGRGVYVAREMSEEAVQTSFHTGKRIGLHQTSTGKALLAFTPHEQIEEIIDRHGLPSKTQNTITDRDELFETLAEIRERGYAYDDEEWHRGLRCVAAPIRDLDDQAVGAVGVAAPLSRTRGERYRSDLPDAVLSTANIIELNMQYS